MDAMNIIIKLAGRRNITCNNDSGHAT